MAIFVSFDGVDGSGKSYAVDQLAARLRCHDLSVYAGKFSIPGFSSRTVESAEDIARYAARCHELIAGLQSYDVVIFDRSPGSFFGNLSY